MNRQRNGLIALAALALSPFVPVLLAAFPAVWFDCDIRYDLPAPCVVAGRDIGPLLSNLLGCLWFLLLTVPLAAAIFAVWAVAWTINVRRKP